MRPRLHKLSAAEKVAVACLIAGALSILGMAAAAAVQQVTLSLAFAVAAAVLLTAGLVIAWSEPEP